MNLRDIDRSLLHCEGLILQFQKDIASLTTHVNILRNNLSKLYINYNTREYTRESYSELNSDVEQLLYEVNMFINGLHLSTATIINNSDHVKYYLEKLKLINSSIPQ